MKRCDTRHEDGMAGNLPGEVLECTVLLPEVWVERYK